jgi:hypothetical protein
LPDRVRRAPLQAAAQARRIGKALQSQQTEKDAVGLEDLRFAHALEAADPHADQSPEQTGGLKIPGRLGRQPLALEQPAQTELLTKTRQEPPPAEVSQVRVVERKHQCSQALGLGQPGENTAFGVPPQPSLKVNFVPEPSKPLRPLQTKDESNKPSRHSRIFEVETVSFFARSNR